MTSCRPPSSTWRSRRRSTSSCGSRSPSTRVGDSRIEFEGLMGLLATNKRRRWRSEYNEPQDVKSQLNGKLNLLKLLVVLAFVVLTVQLARLQLMRGSEFEQRAQLNQLRVEPVIPSRGMIYDRNGVPVVENVPSFSAAVVPADITKG